MAPKIKVEGDIGTLGMRRVLLTLEELNLAYDLVPKFPVPITHFDRWDFQKVPFFKDGDLELKDATSFTILSYLTRGGLLDSGLRGQKLFAMAEELKWHEFESIGPKLVWEQIFKFSYSGGTTDPTVVREEEAKLDKFLNRCENVLLKYAYLNCDHFTRIDLEVFSLIHYLLGTSTRKLLEDKNRPRVSAWIAKIMSRPSSQKVLGLN